MKRPTLSTSLTAEEFAAWYWLKEELVAFCREHGISYGGLKREVEARVALYLAGKTPGHGAVPARRTIAMPKVFTPDTVMGEGWRCGPALGRYFKSLLGNGFHFNAEMREFIHHGEGKTLADAAICYQQSVRPGRKMAQIPEQLEYNRHFREYFRQHAGATRELAIAAWWEKRGRRKDGSNR